MSIRNIERTNWSMQSVKYSDQSMRKEAFQLGAVLGRIQGLGTRAVMQQDSLKVHDLPKIIGSPESTVVSAGTL